MISTSDILQGKILIVDDQEVNILLFDHILRSAGYACVTSTMDPDEVCELHLKNRYDLIVLDIKMPGMNGFQVLERLREMESDGYLSVLVVTAYRDHKLRALQAGAKDFISLPFEQAEVLARIHNMIEVRLLHNELQNFNDALEQKVQERTAELQEGYLETIFTMTRAVEHRDEDLGAHMQRISYFCRELARILHLGEEFAEHIFIASLMHDVGKIGIPDQILLKPGRLTPVEWETMKEHTTIGSKIIGNSKSPYLIMGADIALNHHERWDGTGYPNGKRGEEIPLAARIMQICDIYDALRSKRPYKLALDHLTTMDILTHGDNSIRPEQFDPLILAAFTQHHQLFCDIYDKYEA
ncbi:MAG TPA: HD domain-containing phosphohydrolase [Anaerolineae bacterium]|jgi:putative two-component system response regulator